MIWVFLILFTAYFMCMWAVVYGVKKLWFSLEKVMPKSGFSIVIPFRNEAENLPALLRTLGNLNYPPHLFEVIFVNDASEDTSEALILAALAKGTFPGELLQNNRRSKSPKKDAISEAIKNSHFEWILTTDADCELPQQWLKSFDGFIQKNNAVMVCGPVLYNSNGSFIKNFQQLDGFSLQAVAMGSFGLGRPMLSNGANMAYRKDAFLKVEGFSGNDHLGSGDDIFLLEKMRREFPGQLHFLKSKEAVVSTKPQTSWRDVINQRVRWASKTSKQKDAGSVLLGVLVFSVNISMLLLPVFMCLFFEALGIILLLILIKILTDYVVVRRAAEFFGIKIGFWNFLLHPFVYAVIVTVVVVRSLRGSYSWKGRTFEKQ